MKATFFEKISPYFAAIVLGLVIWTLYTFGI